MADQTLEPRYQLTLQSGRKITLQRLDQRMHYADALMGAPNARTNREHIKVALEEAGRFSASEISPHLSPPITRGYRREPGDSPRMSGVAEWLPDVRCIGLFHSFPACKPENFYSALVVVWFQEEYAFPIEESALSELLALDWEALATDFDVSQL